MLRSLIILTAAGAMLSACTPRQYSYVEARALCQDKADAAAGPQGNASVGFGTGGPSASLGISISDSYLRGDDPQIVFDTCMNNLMAAGQIVGGTP